MHVSPTSPQRPPGRPGPAKDAEVAAAIASYTPTRLPERRWAHRANVVRAAVAASNPPSGKVARLLLVHLCQFLSTPCGWAGDSVPDLAAMLTETTIAAYTYPGVKPANRASGIIRRTSLRRIARAAGSAAPAARRYATTTTALRPELLAAARQPLPLAAIAQAWEHSHGRVLPQEAFRPVVAALPAEPADTAAGPGAGTLPLSGSVRVLAEATDQSVKEVAASIKKPSPMAAPQRPKQLSRRAVLRYARANLAAGQAHRAGPTLADAPAPGALSEEMTAAIVAYLPEKKNRGSWAEVRELTRRLTMGYAPPSPGNAGSTATHVAAFLRWFLVWPGRADVNAPPGLQGAAGGRRGGGLLALRAGLARVRVHPARRPAPRAAFPERVHPGSQTGLPARVSPVQPSAVRPVRGLGPAPAQPGPQTQHGLPGWSGAGRRT